MFDSGPLVRAVPRITGKVGDKLKAEVKRRTPIAELPPGMTPEKRGRVPGTLRESWQNTDVQREQSRTPGGMARSIETFTEDEIAKFVEWPTRPHIIRPRLDRAPASVVATGKPRRAGGDPAARLRYVNAFGRVVYAAEVHHPGTQGVHMVRDSLAEIEATWVDEIGAREIEEWAREQAELVRG